MDTNDINWDTLNKDVPIGHTAGLLLGKLAGGIVYTVRHPIVGASQVAGSCEGFFKGIKDGLEITQANFELSRMRGSVKKMTAKQQKDAADVIKGMSRINETDTALGKLLQQIRDLPESVKKMVFTEEQLTPVPSA